MKNLFIAFIIFKSNLYYILYFSNLLFNFREILLIISFFRLYYIYEILKIGTISKTVIKYIILQYDLFSINLIYKISSYMRKIYTIFL